MTPKPVADFNTHLAGAALVSGLSATGLMLAEVVSQQEVVNYFLLGTVGGLLPDIDSESSIPFRMAFNVLGVVAGFLVILSEAQDYSLAEMIILWTFCFAAVRFGICSVFCRFTEHRGLIHSIPAAALSGLLAVLLFSYLGEPAEQAWMAGGFIVLGFLVHLLLDEIYSVDLLGQRFKRSFGSAFNLGAIGNPLGTLALYVVIVLLYFQAPTPQPFLDRVMDGERYRVLAERLIPQGRPWFQGWWQSSTLP